MRVREPDFATLLNLCDDARANPALDGIVQDYWQDCGFDMRQWQTEWTGHMQDWLLLGPSLIMRTLPIRRVNITSVEPYYDRQLGFHCWYKFDPYGYHPHRYTPGANPPCLPGGIFCRLRSPARTGARAQRFVPMRSLSRAFFELSDACIQWARDGALQNLGVDMVY